MMVVEYDSVELDHCVRCEGTWFDRGELSLLLEGIDPGRHGLAPEDLDSLPEAETTEHARRCPICRRKMRKLLVGPDRNVLIDACPRADGLWFDSNEVAELAQQVLDAASGPTGQAIKFMGRVFRKQDSPGADHPRQEEGEEG